MTRRSRSRSTGSPTVALPTGDVPTSTGVVRLVPDRDGTGVTLLLDSVPSSHLDLTDPTRLSFEYMQQMTAAIDWRFGEGGALRAVHLGGAGCALPRALDALRPGSRQLVAEIDARLAEAVRGWFALPRSPALRIRVADARDAVMSLPDGSADVIVRDVFAPSTVPPHLTSVEFFAGARRALSPGGLLLANHAGTVSDVAQAQLLRRELAGLREVFGAVALVVEPAFQRGRRHANVVSLAAPEASAFERADALDRTLRCLPVPVRLLRDAQVDRFVGEAAPLRDAELLSPPGDAKRPAPA